MPIRCCRVHSIAVERCPSSPQRLGREHGARLRWLTPRCPWSLESVVGQEAFRLMLRKQWTSASVKGLNEVFGKRARPRKFRDALFAFNSVGANNITNPNVAFGRTGEDHGGLHWLAGAVGVIDGIKRFLEEPFCFATGFAFVGLFRFLCTEKAS